MVAISIVIIAVVRVVVLINFLMESSLAAAAAAACSGKPPCAVPRHILHTNICLEQATLNVCGCLCLSSEGYSN